MVFRAAAIVVVGVVVGSLVAGAVGAPAASDPGPTTLVQAGGRIYGFAQDGNILAWAANDGPAGRCPPVRMRNIASGRVGVIGYAGVDTCDEYGFWIAVAGRRALWGGWEPANSPLGTIDLGELGRPSHGIASLESDYGEAGDFLIDIVGDGETLVYATLTVAPNDWDACFPEMDARKKSCRFAVTGGAVKRISGKKAVVIPRLPPSTAIAVNPGRVAVVPASRRWGRALRPELNGPVQIRDATTGRLVLSVRPRGEVEAVALSKLIVAAIVRQGQSRWLEIYDIRTRKLRSKVGVHANVAPQISAAGERVVFSEGKAIRVLRAGARNSWLVTTASVRPLDLSFEGNRLAWAETTRIRAVELR